MMPSDHLAKHTHRAHPVEESRVAPAPPPKADRRVTCRVCKVGVKPTNLTKHMKRVHGIVQAGPAPVSNHGKKTSAPRIGTAMRVHRNDPTETLNEPDQRAVERRLDASRDYYRFRENGRFGSHSVHDDFGDESGAD
jgi:hypothetical protein